MLLESQNLKIDSPTPSSSPKRSQTRDLKCLAETNIKPAWRDVSIKGSTGMLIRKDPLRFTHNEKY